MNFTDQQFYRQQLIRRQGGQPKGAVRVQKVVAPSFSPAILATETPADDGERLAQWHRKRFAQRMARIDQQRMSAVRKRALARFEEEAA